MLQPSALEDHAGLVGEHLEQAQVLVIETGHLAETVGDEHRAHHVVLAAQHHRHRVAQPALVEERAGIAVGAAADSEQKRRVEQEPADELQLRLVERDRRHELRRDLLVDRRAQHGVALAGGQERDLRALGAEHLARLPQETGDGLIHRFVALQVLGRLVQEVDLAALLALSDVEAIRDEDAERRDGEQPELRRVVPDEPHADERQAGVDSGARQREAERRGDTGGIEVSLREGDRREDHPRLEDARGEDRDQHADEAGRAEWIVVVDEIHEQQRCHAVGDREVGEVERQLQRRLAAVERQRDGGSGDVREHHNHGRREEESHDERKLAEREGLRIAAELDVDDEHLGGAEERSQHPPGNLPGG